MEYSTVAPALAALPIERVLIGDVIYGWEKGGNHVRKGWHLESEPVTVDGKGLVESDDRWMINNIAFLKTDQPPRYVLIAKPELANE